MEVTSNLNTEVVVPDRGSWKFRSTRGGFLELLRTHRFKSTTPTLDALGPYWILGLASIAKGKVRYRTSSGNFELSDDYGIFIGPWAIVHGSVETPLQEIRCVISDAKLPPEYRESAFMFRVRPNEVLPQNVSDLIRRLNRAEGVVPLQYNSTPSTLARRIKALIDATYSDATPISTIAAKLRISTTTVGRVFRKNFGVAPVKYRNHMRVAISSFQLLLGKMITDVFQDVGFADLSRYNKNFREVTGSSPRHFQGSTRSRPKK